MAEIINLQNNIKFILKPINNVDINSVDDFKNWIGFEMKLDSGMETLVYSKDNRMMLNFFEIKGLLNKINMFLEKNSEQVEYYSIERYFDLKIKSISEQDKFEVVLWFNMGNYTNGEEYGYDKGYKFYVNFKSIYDFYLNLTEELRVFYNDFEI